MKLIVVSLFVLSVFGFSQNKITSISLTKVGNFSAQDKIRLEKIISNLNKIINTKEFEDQIINHRVGGELRFENNNNETNEQIYNKIMSGTEILDVAEDYEWKLNLNLRWLFNRSTLAYTEFKTPEIYINSRYYNRGSDADIAGTICHEYMHKMGYSHSREYTEIRPSSVPYAIGSICETLYVNNFGLNYPQRRRCGVLCTTELIVNTYFK